MGRRRTQVEPVRLTCRLWGKPYDSGTDGHDCQGWRCHEVGEKSLCTSKTGGEVGLRRCGADLLYTPLESGRGGSL